MALDLDQTLIYSDRFDGVKVGVDGSGLPSLVLVEHHEPSGTRCYVANAIPGMLRALAVRAWLVPVTTRSVEQYRRVTVEGLHPSPYALCANGGVLLVDGHPDPKWTDARLVEVRSTGFTPGEAAAILAPLSSRSARVVDDLFCYIVLDAMEPPSHLLRVVDAALAARGWDMVSSGRKVYAVPEPLSKGSAVAALARRLGVSAIAAVGDSELDVDLLELADLAIAPAHGSGNARRAARLVTRSVGLDAAVEALALLTQWASAIDRQGDATSRVD